LTLAQLLNVVSDNQRIATKTTLDNPVIAVLRTERHVIYVNRVVCGDGIHLFLALEFIDRCLRNQDCVMANLGRGLHSAELTWAKNVARIWESRSDPNRAGLRIQLSIYENHVPFFGIDFPIGEGQGQRNVRRAVKKIVATRARLFRQREILAVGNGKVNFDWIELLH